jgi:hypothetical protein
MVVAGALPVGAAPTNGNSARVLELDCDGEDVVVLVQWESESAAAFDVAGANGRRYVLSSVEFRVFAGDPPVGDPIFETTKTWGNRNGYNERLVCTGSTVDEDPTTGELFTAEFDVVLAGK